MILSIEGSCDNLRFACFFYQPTSKPSSSKIGFGTNAGEMDARFILNLDSMEGAIKHSVAIEGSIKESFFA